MVNSEGDGNTSPPYQQQLEPDMEQQTGSKLGKEYVKGVYCHLAFLFFNLYAEYIRRSARLDEAQAGIRIARGDIKNLRYADDTTHMAESEEELKRLLLNVKEESEKVGLKLNIQKTKIMASLFHHFMANRWGNNGNRDRLYFLGLQNQCRW